MIKNKIITISIKLVIKSLRLVGFSGSALPGLIVEKINPKFLKEILSELPEGVVLITGTNGKTTTNRLLYELVSARGYKVLTNKTGSNFTRGIIASIIDQSPVIGKLEDEFDIAIFEVDEAYSRLIAKQIPIRSVTVLNIFRDQLDRYGEIDKTAAMIAETLTKSMGAVLNADDPPVVKLSKYLGEKKITYFGVTQQFRKSLPTDEEMLTKALKPADNKKHKKQVLLTGFKEMDSGSQIKIRIGQQDLSFKTRLLGIHNAVNITAAVATLYHLYPNTEFSKLAKVISNFSPAFGRGEELKLGHKHIKIGLIKNPAGFNQNLRSYISNSVGVVIIAINDNYADGRDVSWLWDVDLTPLKKKNLKIIVTGTRAYDMALRLQYADIDFALVDTNIKRALKKGIELAGDEEILILPTYTAMLNLRKLLAKGAKVTKIWR